MSLARFIADQRTEHGVPHTVACRALGRSTSWLYKWLDRAPTPRQRRRAELAERIHKSFVDSWRTYGSPRVVLDLRADGQRVSVNTVAKIMRLECLVARPCRRRHGLTRQGKRPAAPDLVRRTFNTVAPNVLWTGDLTEIGTGEGTLYLACVLDMFSRNALGHAFSAHHDADLAVAALQQAAARRGGPADGVIFHTASGAASTPHRRSPRPVRGWASRSLWVAPGPRWTTPSRRRSTQRSRWSTSTATSSPPAPRPSRRSRPGLMGSTTCDDVTAPTTACHRSTSRNTWRRLESPPSHDPTVHASRGLPLGRQGSGGGDWCGH
jgi:putative transposase